MSNDQTPVSAAPSRPLPARRRQRTRAGLDRQRAPLALAALLLAGAPGTAALAADAVAEVPDEMLAVTCFSCHGPDGHSAGAMPAIAGKDASYIASRLRDWRADRRTDTVMNRIAKGFTEAEIDRIAAWFAAR